MGFWSILKKKGPTYEKKADAAYGGDKTDAVDAGALKKKDIADEEKVGAACRCCKADVVDWNAFNKKGPTHAEKVSAAYRCYKPDVVEMIFPGGWVQAEQVILSLSRICGVDLETCDARTYHDMLTSYTDVLVPKVIELGDDEMILGYLQKSYPNLVKTEEMARCVVEYTALNMGNHDFALKNDTDVSLLQGYVRLHTSSEQTGADTQEDAQPTRRRMPQRDKLPQGDDLLQIVDLSPSVQETSGDTAVEEIAGSNDGKNTLSYYFENLTEFAFFIHLHSKDQDVDWLSGNDYLELCQKGYQLVEQENFTEAIRVLEQALTLNPVGLSARFEMVEAYLRLNDLAAAKRTLLSTYPYLATASQIARFYRRMGYIAIEEKNYKCAAACYAFSRTFEDHKSINEELLYLRTLKQFDVGAVLRDPVAVLNQFGIPVYSEDDPI